MTFYHTLISAGPQQKRQTTKRYKRGCDTWRRPVLIITVNTRSGRLHTSCCRVSEGVLAQIGHAHWRWRRSISPPELSVSQSDAESANWL